MRDVDYVVLGAGFGGLGAALTLAESGANVAICEALKYPGGCASTFTRGGARYEAGATLFAGLGEDQLFGRWRREHDLPVEFELLAEPIELRAPGLALPVCADRAAFVERLCALPGAPQAGIRALFALQERVADALWPVLADPGLLPPFAPGALGWHLRRAGAYLPLLPLVGRPLGAILRRYGLAQWRPLRSYLDAICQITVQTSAEDAEAPFALSAMDYCFRGVGHVRGGIGELAWALLRAAERRGGEARLADRVSGLEREGDRWIVRARGGDLRAGAVIANVLPQAARALLPGDAGPIRALDRLGAAVERGWGAAMLYLVCDGEGLREEPHHLQLIRDDEAPLVLGNHVFCSISAASEGRGLPPGHRAVTCSTHVSQLGMRGMQGPVKARHIALVQALMRETIAARAPELAGRVRREMTASPRTFARFTRRPEGLVGGIPRLAGLAQYRGLLPRPVLPGLYLVGDSVFPGQSVLAAALGGARTARAALGEGRGRSG